MTTFLLRVENMVTDIETKDLSETEVIKVIQDVLRGNTNAFEYIYDTYYKMVISIIRRIVKPNPSEIDAFVNEAFLIVYKGLKGFKGEAKFSTYVYRIVLNYAFKASKKKLKDKKHMVTFKNNEEEDNILENISDNKHMEEQIVTKDSVEGAISTLNQDMQEVVDLYYFERYSVKEIANIVGTTETAIKNRLYQARNKIKVFLSKEGYYGA